MGWQNRADESIEAICVANNVFKNIVFKKKKSA